MEYRITVAEQQLCILQPLSEELKKVSSNILKGQMILHPHGKKNQNGLQYRQ